jgi:hypothetical protein
MAQIFLYQQWLHQQLHEYAHASQPPKLHGRRVVMPIHQYGAALMQAYLGGNSLIWIAEQIGIPIKRVRQWRQDLQFLLVMDWSKPIFSDTFKEKLIINDYSVTQYHTISAEVSLLEKSLRLSVRSPLYRRFAKLGQRLISQHQNDIDFNTYDLRLFRRLFLFFLCLEYHWSSKAQGQIRKNFLPLAKDVVWPLLKQKAWIEPSLESLQQNTPLSQIRLDLGSRLNVTFHRFI